MPHHKPWRMDQNTQDTKKNWKKQYISNKDFDHFHEVYEDRNRQEATPEEGLLEDRP